MGISSPINDRRMEKRQAHVHGAYDNYRRRNVHIRTLLQDNYIYLRRCEMNKETIVAIVRIVLPCIISILGLFGITSIYGIELSSINVEGVCAFVAMIVGVLMSIYTGWKNNNVTESAKAVQNVLDFVKAGYITIDDIESFVETVECVKEEKECVE